MGALRKSNTAYLSIVKSCVGRSSHMLKQNSFPKENSRYGHISLYTLLKTTIQNRQHAVPDNPGAFCSSN